MPQPKKKKVLKWDCRTQRLSRFPTQPTNYLCCLILSMKIHLVKYKQTRSVFFQPIPSGLGISRVKDWATNIGLDLCLWVTDPPEMV